VNIKDFRSGKRLTAYKYKYFLPEKINHSFVWTDETINELLETASLKLGELNSFARFIPDADMFIKMHIYKEAVGSNKIEGTQTNIEEAFFDENEIRPERRDDWKEVNNYVQAMNYAIESLKTIPLSNRLIRETHKFLLASVRGEHKQPGEFRRSQNWIGGATLQDAVFVPPVHTEVPDLMSDLERFLNNEDIKVPHLIRIAIAHYQFETIHPFLDGNGRTGRLLITLYLISKGILEKPLLYLSDFFEKHRQLYYDNLTACREKSDLPQWIKFFLVAVVDTSGKSCSTLKSIIDYKNDVEKESIHTLGRRIKSGLTLLHYLFSKPVIQVRDVEKAVSLSPKAANDLIQQFVKLGILKEITGYQRNRVFVFDKYIKAFEG
jgi:Fic family protein